MRRMFFTAVTFIFVLAAVLPVAMAQEPVRTIPIESLGFGAKLSPDGKTLVTFENTILANLEAVDPSTLPMRVIDVSTGEQVGELTGFTDYAADVAFSSDGSRMVSLHMNGDVLVWDMTTRTVTKTYQTLLMGSLQIELGADDRTAFIQVAGVPQRIALFDIETGAVTAFVGKHFDSNFDFRQNYTQFPGSTSIIIAAMAVSPDGKTVATANGNDEVGLWSVADNRYQIIREASEKPGLFSVRKLLFTPDGQSLIYSDQINNQTHVWNIAAGTDQSFEGGSETMALSPDGTRLAWGTWSDDGGSISIAPLDALDEGTVIYDVPEGLRIAQRVTWMAFTPDSSQLVVGGFFASDPTTNEIVVLDV
ncbi:MAG: WD40 repeat domain-containing protein [Chloroflexi bacterium]|nr:WD40 repeat domain-containing protein [Chloroflexota bacterium]